MSLATRDQLLKFGATCPRHFGEATLPVSGFQVRFQSLSEGERSRYEMDGLERGDDGTYFRPIEAMEGRRRQLIALCLVDESGARLLKDEDAVYIEDWHGADAGFLYQRLLAHCGMNETAAEREALRKNGSSGSGTTAGAASPSSSPSAGESKIPSGSETE